MGSKLPEFLNWKKWWILAMYHLGKGLKHKVKAAFMHRIRVFTVMVEERWEVSWAGNKKDNEDSSYYQS